VSIDSEGVPADTVEKNRWLIAASAMLIRLSIGSVYAYSVYQQPLQASQGWSIGDMTLGFTVAIFTLGMSTAALDRYVERYGPRASGTAATVAFAGGTVLAGVGLGLGYISPISTLVKWFPDRRGLATGLAVMGFGAGALVTGPVANYLIGATSIPTTFYVLGAGYFVAMAAGASYLEKPPAGWVPAGIDPDAVVETDSHGVIVASDLEQRTANEAIRTPQFYSSGCSSSSTSRRVSCSCRWRRT